MNFCPLLFIANKSFKQRDKKILYNCNCLEKECIWYNNDSQECKLRNEPDKLNYVEKTIKCISF